MTDPKPAEPSMEEILASIRQIINQNDTPVDEIAPALDTTARDTAADAADAIDNAPEDDDVLELTAILADDVEADPVTETITQEDIVPATLDASYNEAAVAQPPEPEVVPPVMSPSHDTLITGMTAAAATASLNSLASTLQQERAEHTLPLGNSSRTLESMVVESMKPLLKDWLDANLPQLVERVVQQEVEKLTRRLGA